LVFNPLNLDDLSGYRKWRDSKRRAYDLGLHKKLISLSSSSVSDSELDTIVSHCDQFNYCLYQLAEPSNGSKAFVRNTGVALGLERLDGNLCSDEDNISSIQVRDTGRHTGYIPYTDKKLTWHTDGYYNDLRNKIRAMILHCASPAASGGENAFVDHEILYLLMRDENPAYIDALMQADVMTIPENIENGVELRAAQTGPVFSIDPQTGDLHMRYTARTRSIEWKDTELVREAVEFIKTFLNSASPYIFHHRLSAGEGIICNNVLHNRSAFEDDLEKDQTRLIFRGRFYERISTE